MLKKKICLLGSFGVGKTSLIRQYVSHVYSEEYISTIGVHISKKELILPSGTELSLLIWDLEGQDEIHDFSKNYLKGMSAYFLVADGTRAETLMTAQNLYQSLAGEYSDIPSILILNKNDLSEKWQLDESQYSDFIQDGIEVIQTSAKTGDGVEAGFLSLAEKVTGL
ncbi:Rab family GTPase [Oceanispirochaeta crateris]|uniref:Rab family GTPase n=1 Tax=Oceanispirochaeta crateris TaxID=2518645 RepID=UPI00143DB8E5|nr:Rab family GTPase [Oceanispirochaeta crateris]